MPRQPRKAGVYMHIIVRGIGKQILFEEDSDRRVYLSFLEKYCRETEIIIFAYCLMENHVHLLIQDRNGSIPIFMKKMGISYAQYYNRKYDRIGHLFQDRYKSECIEDERYLLTVFRYILNNPWKAGLCAASQYPWSSYHEYGQKGRLTNTEMLCEMIGSDTDFQQFMLQRDETECMEAEHRKKDDTWAQEMIRKTLHIPSGTQLQKYERKQRDEALALLKKKGLTVRQLERLTGINRGVVQKAKGVNENRPS